MSADKKPPQLGIEDVQLSSSETLYDGFFKVHGFTIRHQMFDGGTSGAVSRELFERGDAVAVLPYDPVTDEVVLVEQFRIGAYASLKRSGENRSPWLIECIAGMIDKGLSPIQTVELEAHEEADIVLTEVKSVMTFYPSPGGTSERIQLFVAKVDSTTAGGVHGVPDENEDIRVLRVKRQDAIDWVNNGLIDNAPTVIAIQWLQLNMNKW